MPDDIDSLIDEVTVDAFNEDEQLWSFRQAFEDDARFPFRATVVGVDVIVTAIDFEGDARRGLIAVCQRDGAAYSVSLLDITPVGPMPLETRQLLEAHRRWSGATPLPTSNLAHTSDVHGAGVLDPSGAVNELACLEAVRTRERWTKPKRHRTRSHVA